MVVGLAAGQNALPNWPAGGRRCPPPGGRPAGAFQRDAGVFLHTRVDLMAHVDPASAPVTADFEVGNRCWSPRGNWVPTSHQRLVARDHLHVLQAAWQSAGFGTDSQSLEGASELWRRPVEPVSDFRHR